MVKLPPRFAKIILFKYHKMIGVDLCASAFTEILDTCTFTLLRALNKIHTDLKNCIDKNNISLCHTPCFRGWVGVERNTTKHYMFL